MLYLIYFSMRFIPSIVLQEIAIEFQPVFLYRDWFIWGLYAQYKLTRPIEIFYSILFIYSMMPYKEHFPGKCSIFSWGLHFITATSLHNTHYFTQQCREKFLITFLKISFIKKYFSITFYA